MPRLQRQVEGIASELSERIIERLLAWEPDATAVLLTGSYAKDTAEAGSDLDLTAITPSPRVGYRTWFEERPRDVPLHVSAGATTSDGWLANAAEPAHWSLGFPALDTAVYLFADGETRTRLGDDASLRHPAAEPELEDFVDFVLKAKRAASAGDDPGLRWFAQSAAALAPRLLIPLNTERVVRDRRDALGAALGLAVAPTGYARDLAACLGVTQASDAEVREAVGRLGAELLAFLRTRAPDVDDQPDLARLLADGTLERHLALID